ncbi:DUF554 domain-containing protein [Saccharibacillus alkalitolerans]|uniref:DUF554 domain-containing protein n=1 Tax=Saccharibacillus alkalitolerans TaxID=2705290 RepID=A0ABX0F0F8_9BACL|nr:DUF554 domain-containing protein [Saccharibacillus alkalitolerans]NGZ73930.1 DUF554 domain-containing protein [Saccharibacillus alkalitolerans]
MFGTWFNAGMIVLGCLIGGRFKKGLDPGSQEILMQAMGLAASLLGISAVVQHLPESRYPVLFIVSLAAGGLLGEKMNLERRFETAITRYFKSGLGEGLATAILLFCIGSLSILGPIEAALNGNYSYLLTNGMLDGITSIVLASTFGTGIAVSALILVGWQGAIYMLAKFAAGALNPDMLNEITIVGGILIFSSGLSILGIRKFKSMNLLPALLGPPVFWALLHTLEWLGM